MSAEQAPTKTDKLIGEVLANRYQIEVRLGEGAMGTVYRAKHVKVGRAFAVKVLHKTVLEDRKVAQRFEREAELAGRLRHPNVVGVVDVGETSDGQSYMVMDFAEGDDLATVLDEAPMRPERVLHLTRQLLEGLYHAHEAGLIHRDFKPENVIIEKDDHGAEIPRIVDFGIAILREGGGDAVHGAGRLTTNGLVLGTPHYMAPEQAVADPIDHRIDLFALGIVIYEMLSGKLPFDGTGAEVARANLLLDPPLISERVPYLEVDPLLEAFARRLMAKKRELRPATAKAAREILDLIERDRAAAAVVLGVAVEGVRTPQVTQDVVPHRPTHEDSGNFMMPLAGPEMSSATVAATNVTPRATDLEAPPVTQQRGPSVTTSSAEPLVWDRDEDVDEQKSKRGWIAAVAAAVAAAAIIVAVSTRGNDETPKAEPDKVVISATEPEPAEPTPSEPTPPPSKPPEPVVGEGSAISQLPDVKPPPVEVKPKVGKRPEPHAKPDKPTEVVKPPGKPHEAVKTADKPTEVVKPVDKPAEVVKTGDKPPDTQADGITANALFAQYKAVGEAIAALDTTAGASELRSRYRMIRFDARATPEQRRATEKSLSELMASIEAIRK